MRSLVKNAHVLLLLLPVIGCSSTYKLNNALVNSNDVPLILAERGRVQFKIVWPERTRLIPVAAESIKIVVRNGTQEVTRKTIPRPTSGNSTIVHIDDLPSGVLSCDVSAHPDVDAQQPPQASGTVDVTIRPKETVSSTITLDSTINSVNFDIPPDVIRPGQEITVNAQAKNNSGEFIVTSPSKWEWSSSNTSAIQLASNGSRVVIKPGSTRGISTITAKEIESGKSASFNVSNLMADSEEDYSLFSKIEKVRSIARNIVIDGKDSDWLEIPSYDDPIGDAGGISGLDIIKSAIVVTEDAYIIRLATDSVDLFNFNKAYQFNIDIMGAIYNTEFAIAVTPGQKTGTLWISEPGQNPVSRNIDNLDIAYGTGITELRIPYTWLKPLLPVSMQEHIPSTSTRPHVRLFTSTFLKTGSEWRVQDQGDCAACYVLKPTPYNLGDPTLPRAATAKKTIIRPPFSGVFWVGQGAFGNVSHQDVWGYDLGKIGRQFQTFSPSGSSRKEDSLSWETPLLAAANGTITAVRDTEIDLDNPPGTDWRSITSPPNYIIERIANNIDVWFIHCRMNSSKVRVGDQVKVGDHLISIGNSGNSVVPGLHLQSQEAGTSDVSKSLTISFVDVKILISPLLNDPWSRSLSVWDVREGYMFTSQ